MVLIIARHRPMASSSSGRAAGEEAPPAGIGGWTFHPRPGGGYGAHLHTGLHVLTAFGSDHRCRPRTDLRARLRASPEHEPHSPLGVVALYGMLIAGLHEPGPSACCPRKDVAHRFTSSAVPVAIPDWSPTRTSLGTDAHASWYTVLTLVLVASRHVSRWSFVSAACTRRRIGGDCPK